MFVSEGAIEKLQTKKKDKFVEHFVVGLIREAKQLHITKSEIQNMIERGFEFE